MSFTHYPAHYENGQFFIHPHDGYARIVVRDGEPLYRVFESDELRHGVQVLYSPRMELESKPDGGRWLFLGGPVAPETRAFYRSMMSAGADHPSHAFREQAGATLALCEEGCIALNCSNEEAVPALVQFFEDHFHIWMGDAYSAHGWRTVIESELALCGGYDRRVEGDELAS